MRPMALIAFPLIAFMLSGMIYANYAANDISTCGNTAFAGDCSANHLQLFSLPNWICAFLPNAESISATCTNTLPNPFFFTSFLGSPSGLMGLLTLVVGVIMLILGSGIDITIPVPTTQARLGENDEGTKFFRNMGIGLLIWTFAVALEGGWCDVLPYGFSGALCLFLELMFILGLYWQSNTEF